MIKRTAWMLLAIVAVAAIGYVAVGGRHGVALLYIEHFIRKDAPPTQEVAWGRGQTRAPETAPAGRRRPNVVLIVADDLGWNDITLDGGGVAGGAVPTPRIDSIAKDGVNFAWGYAGNATCSRSRAAMMTGRYATRFGFEFTSVPVQFARLVGGHTAPGALREPIYHAELESLTPPYEEMGMPPAEATIAKVLKGAGYRTLHVGKWHLGEAPRFRPNAHGFDDSLGFLAGASMYLPEGDPGVVNSKQDFDPIDRFFWAAHPFHVRFNGGEPFRPGRYLTDYLTDEAVRAIEANRDRPFFLCLAYNAPHTPLQAAKAEYDALVQLFWRSGPYRVVRAGRWKLQVTDRPARDWLYDLDADPGEKNDLAAREPAKVQELQARLAAFDKEQAAPLWPALIEAPITLDKTLDRPQASDDAHVYWSN